MFSEMATHMTITFRNPYSPITR